jgi:hypothetical protein
MWIHHRVLLMERVLVARGAKAGKYHTKEDCPSLKWGSKRYPQRKAAFWKKKTFVEYWGLLPCGRCRDGN